ncbi:MAG: UvrD-helicase domain-containing protein, partial [Nocardioidaceae bacterium]
MTDDMKPFDVLGPLPAGVAVLEASAGTGKTYTIAALAARFVADGLPLENLLVVTFTRMATGELRERVRDRLVGTERALAAIAAGTSVDDPVAQLMATGSTEEVALRRARLSQAVAEFDAATITTTHGFCLEVLGSLGFAGDIERGCAFVEDVADLVDEIVDDLYIRRFWNSTPAFSRSEAAAIVAAAIANPAAHLEPTAAPPDTVAAMRLRLAVAARAELERRKRRMSIMTFDDLLTRLDDTLTGPGGDEVAARLRSRYRVVLVDEFQDTDPVQWSIMRRAFGANGSTLVLIGDPKQAIYAFRGADVYAYLDAAASAGTSETLDVNWRSDQGLITAYDALFAGARLGHEGIVYRRVTATPANQTPRLSGAPSSVPLRVRVVDRNAPAVGTTRAGYAVAACAREHVAADLATDVVALLSSHAEIETRADDGTVSGRRRVQPGDIAVLVRTHKNAAMVRDALYALSVPAVINGAGSVFGSLPARDWLRLLEALERPTSAQRARSAAMTPFIGWDAERVAAADDDAWEAVHRRLHHWAEVLRVKGVASLTETISLGTKLAERVLAVENGERSLTDLRHVGQLLHAAATADHLGTAALTAWLRRRIAMAGEETDEERSRRLESDAAAVQVLTIHRSKGIEFPIVYYPYLWEPTWIPDEPAPVFFHDPQENGRRTLDVGLDGPDFAGNKLQH